MTVVGGTLICVEMRGNIFPSHMCGNFFPFSVMYFPSLKLLFCVSVNLVSVRLVRYRILYREHKGILNNPVKNLQEVQTARSLSNTCRRSSLPLVSPSTISSSLFAFAALTGDQPCSPYISTSALCLSSRSTTGSLPAIDATCSGVLLFRDCAFTSASLSRRHFATSTCPRNAAM
jgi:hypothetical protein